MKSKIIKAMASLMVLLAMTGMAAAMDADIMDSAGANPAPASVKLAQGQSIDLNFKASSICANNEACTPPISLPVSAVIVPLNGGAVSDLAITGIPMDPANMPVSFNNPQTLVPFTVKNVAAPPGKTYRVTIIAGDLKTSLDFGSASRPFQSIPEYATVAMPVAAIMGLVFLVYRKRKED